MKHLGIDSPITSLNTVDNKSCQRDGTICTWYQIHCHLKRFLISEDSYCADQHELKNSVLVVVICSVLSTILGMLVIYKIGRVMVQIKCQLNLIVHYFIILFYYRQLLEKLQLTVRLIFEMVLLKS